METKPAKIQELFASSVGKISCHRLYPAEHSFPTPSRWNHINLTDDYSWRRNERVEKGGFRPLRFPPQA